MKKILAMIAAAALSMSLCVTAFAATEGTQEVYVDIPEGGSTTVWGADYTMTIPASQAIEYGNTDYQNIGAVQVTASYRSSVAWHGYVTVTISGDGQLKNTNGKTLAYSLSGPDVVSHWRPSTTVDYTGNSHDLSFSFDSPSGATVTVTSDNLRMKVDNWNGAEAGTRYTTTLTYTADGSFDPM